MIEILFKTEPINTVPFYVYLVLLIKHLLFQLYYGNIFYVRGGVAQLGECLNGIQEVVGSIPIVSTTKKKHRICSDVFLFIYNLTHYRL